MGKRNKIQHPYSREKAIHLYVQALDRGEMEVVAQILDAACDDPELERIITEINSAYQEEEELTPIAVDAQIIRGLLHKHLHSAFEVIQEDDKPLVFEDIDEEEKAITVGDVVQRLHDINRVPSADRDVITKLIDSSVPLPVKLSIQAVRKLALELGITASERFLDMFRDTAITLSMGRSHSRGQLAAAREQKGRYKTLSNNRQPINKKTKNDTGIDRT
ncbi:hypothetical protein [Mastigocoleus testarum]|uniref:Uncharacterized protein n=1 Tax=Mastigocoleus testarum BC008 TaxID=371196 RepID=A0A0V7ZVX8_9CYAN|nr:hypothetical protein [Mastigocoleus testarum]KST68008.1 hypothetical protein BC008_32000 [Mastigocoleus testarum BC008]KST68367.1 hypothetical protein BC008_33125 [Mastigocoleus testarum BC008]